VFTEAKHEEVVGVRCRRTGKHRHMTAALLLIALAATTAVGIAAWLRQPTTPSRTISSIGRIMTARQAIALEMPGRQDGVTRSAAKLTTWDEALAACSPGTSVPGSSESLTSLVWVVAFSVKYSPPFGVARTPPDHWIAFIVDRRTGNNPAIFSGPATWPPCFDSIHGVGRTTRI
jgi:hypothetical protein